MVKYFGFLKKSHSEFKGGGDLYLYNRFLMQKMREKLSFVIYLCGIVKFHLKTDQDSWYTIGLDVKSWPVDGISPFHTCNNE